MYDLVIKNGKLIDGTGSPEYRADIAVNGGKIVRIARGITGGEKVIDASGLTVTPGFIDSHSHSDNCILTYPDQTEKAEQGITTSIGGQCGSSPAPLHRDTPEDLPDTVGDYGRAVDVYRTMGSFLDIAKDVPLGANIAVFSGHRALRAAVMGFENRKPTTEELEKMKALLRDAIEHGAIGISFGLIYYPSCFADTDELIELAKVAAEYDALVAAHIRDEGDMLVRAVEEFIGIIRASGVRGIISHHKTARKENWGKVSHTLRMIDQANSEGLEIYCDVYPYCASYTSLTAHLIPKEYTVDLAKSVSDPDIRRTMRDINLKKYGKDLSYILLSTCPRHPEFEEKTLDVIAKMQNKDVYDAVFDLIKDGGGSACYFTMCEEDVETVLAYPRAMICTDMSIVTDKQVYHPRLRGTFPRVLGRYVRERGVTTLPDMIRKMTSMPAAVYNLTGKGLLREGFDADICIFDAEKIIDRAEYLDCSRRAEGLNYVIISGEIVVENAVYNGKRKGKVILR